MNYLISKTKVKWFLVSLIDIYDQPAKYMRVMGKQTVMNSLIMNIIKEEEHHFHLDLIR